MSIEETLAEREQQHGSFAAHATIECKLMAVIAEAIDEKSFTDVQKIGLHMIMHKVARICNDGHRHADSWHDIAGYATLVERDMEENDICVHCLAQPGRPHEPDCPELLLS